MPELHLRRIGELLTVTLGENTTPIPFTDIAPDEEMWQRIYEDASAYGRELFGRAFRK